MRALLSMVNSPHHRYAAIAVLCLTAGAFLVYQATLWGRQAAQLEVSLEMVNRRAAPAGQLPPGKVSDDANREGGKLISSLPPSHERESRLNALIASARDASVRIKSMEVVREMDAVLPVERARLHVPMRGSYAALTSFMAQALASDSALSLDGVRLRRGSLKATEIEAELDFTFFAYTGADKSLTQ